MTTRRRRMREDLQLRGLAPQPQQGDVAAVHHRAQHDRRAPDQLRDEELRPSCLVRVKEKQVAAHLPPAALWDPVLLRAHAAATMASLRPHATPAHPKTPRRVASAAGPVPASLGRAPDSPDVSAGVVKLMVTSVELGC